MVTLSVVPCFDEITEYSKVWAERLWTHLSDVEHVSLDGEDAVRSKFEKAIERHDPKIISFYDHGGKGRLYGNDGKPLLDEWNAGLTAGREVYTTACSSCARLGPSAYRKGCKAYWGYDKPFTFVVHDEKVFGRLANMGLILRMETGDCWSVVFTAVRKAYDEELDRLRDTVNPWTLIALVNNKLALTLYCEKFPPESDCPFRNLGVTLFGEAGLKLSKLSVVAVTLFLVFYGVSIHAIASELWMKGGWREVASFQGEWIGLAGLFASALLFFREHLKWLGKK